MRIVIVDMHRINFISRTYSMLKVDDKIARAKHRFLFDYAMSTGAEIVDYVTGRGSQIKGGKYISKVFGGDNVANYEAKYVLKENFPDKNIGIITDAAEIKDDDIVIGYLFDAATMDVIQELPGHKVLMSNHFIATNEPYDLNRLGIEALVSEIDLSSNEFVNRYIKHDGVKMITCPYVFADRFCNKHYDNRKNKAFAVGTLSTCAGNHGYKLYREMFGTEWIQLMRKEIYDKADRYPEEIDSYISYIYEDKLVAKDSDSAIRKKYVELRNKCSTWTQRKYESFDMVEKFNEYHYFVCPEELAGMPGIGFVEGMACGTAYIGIDAQYYRDLGMIPGVHYFTYDGTMEGLIDVIHYCSGHLDLVQKVAKNGEEFVRSYFNSRAVAMNFVKDLSALLENK